MPARHRKVEKPRQKRRKKQRQARVFSLRQHRALPSDAHPLHACLANADWDETGKAAIFMAREVGPGRVTLASFLVDTWAMGLKDAWGRTDIAVSEFEENIARYNERVEVSPMNLGTARHLVYGGIQLANELGFRLPKRYERWTTILGPLPQGESPDMSLFLRDGKILVTCPAREFEERLISTTPRKFLSRPDVNFIFGAEDFGDFEVLDADDDAFDAAGTDEDADRSFEDAMERIETAMFEDVREWCFANGQAPHPLLKKVVGAALEGTLQGMLPGLDPAQDTVDAIPASDLDAALRSALEFMAATCHDDPAGLERAFAQFDGYMRSLDPQKFLAKCTL